MDIDSINSFELDDDLIKDYKKEEKFKLYNQALIHAVECKDRNKKINNCMFPGNRCVKVRSNIAHFVRCYGERRKSSSNINDCDACAKIWGLLCYHARHCQYTNTNVNSIERNNIKCPIPQCTYIKLKLKNNKKDISVQERIQASERDRIHIMQMLEDLRKE